MLLDTKDQLIKNTISAPKARSILEEKINIVLVNRSVMGHREAMGTQRRDIMHEKPGKAHKKCRCLSSILLFVQKQGAKTFQRSTVTEPRKHSERGGSVSLSAGSSLFMKGLAYKLKSLDFYPKDEGKPPKKDTLRYAQTQL